MRTLFILLLALNLNAQDGISIGVFHDIKLGLGLDKEHFNNKPTKDLIFVMDWQGKQFQYYYFSIQSFYETADLYDGDFKRYGVNLMWNFNRLIIEGLEIGVGAGFGVIHRPESHASYSFTADLSHSFSKSVSISLKNEFVRRSELEVPKLGYNLSIGLEYKLINL